MNFTQTVQGAMHVKPAKANPDRKLLEEIRNVLELTKNLKKAREIWYSASQDVCLENQMWNLALQIVVTPKQRIAGSLLIVNAGFDPLQEKTVLTLADRSRLGIRL